MRRLRRWTGAAGVILGPAAAGGQAGTATKTITALAETPMVFPANVTSVGVDVVGARGSYDYTSSGTPGRGGHVTATLAITSGQYLYANVGVGGGDGGRASGNFLIGGVGGGASDVRTCSAGGVCPGGSLGTRRAVAGGGGGAGAGTSGGGAGGGRTARALSSG